MTSAYEHIKELPPLEVFAIGPACRADPNPSKVDLCRAGCFINEEGQLSVFPVVEKAEKSLHLEDKSYLPVLGKEEYTTASTKLVLGESSKTFKDKRFVAAQTLSGTGALRVAAEFLAKVLKKETFYVSKPTWENHHRIFLSGGLKEMREYTYWDASKRCLDFSGLRRDLESAPNGAVVILQVIAHNPTGVDPSKDEWKEIAQICKKRQLFPVFDCVRQGFVSTLDEDAWVVRYFADEAQLEIAVCQSFAKNFALYNERIGNLFITSNDKLSIPALRSQLTHLVRGNYSNPPAKGAEIVSAILNDKEMRKQLGEDLTGVRKRVQEMRDKLYARLKAIGTPGDWEHIKTQRGIFFYSGLSPNQVEELQCKYGLYMFRCCHLNVTCLNMKNLDYVAQAIHSVVTD